MQFFHNPWTLTFYHPSPKGLSVQLGYGICPEEQAFLGRRKQVVAAALQLMKTWWKMRFGGCIRDVGKEILAWSVPF